MLPIGTCVISFVPEPWWIVLILPKLQLGVKRAPLRISATVLTVGEIASGPRILRVRDRPLKRLTASDMCLLAQAKAWGELRRFEFKTVSLVALPFSFASRPQQLIPRYQSVQTVLRLLLYGKDVANADTSSGRWLAPETRLRGDK
jgi:hypothetical protein